VHRRRSGERQPSGAGDVASSRVATRSKSATARKRASAASGARPKSGGRKRRPTKPSGAGRSRPESRAEQRRVATVRRARILLIGAISVSVLVLGAWFPASALYQQRQQLAATSTQLNALHAEDKALTVERQRLSEPSEIERIARQQYQLIQPGQRAYQVLPFNGASSATSPYPGDPGLQAPVAPSGDSELPAGSATATSPPSSTAPDHKATSSTSTRTTAATPNKSLLSRIALTLEFWR